MLRTGKEVILLSLVLQHPHLSAPLARVMRPEWITPGDMAGRLLNRVLAEAENGERAEAGMAAVDAFGDTDAERDMLFRILAATPPYGDEPAKGVNECLKIVHRDWVNRRIDKLDAQIALEEEADFARLHSERSELSALLKRPPSIG
jgi:hypothetical protein